MPTHFAILISVSDYQQNPLKHNHNDVEKLNDALQTYCKFEKENIKTIISRADQTIENIYSVFEECAQEIAANFQEGDNILFYFSGHGHYSNTSILELHKDMVPVQKFYNVLSALPCKHQVYIIDSCKSGHGVELKSSGSENELLASYLQERIDNKADGTHLLCSSSSNEQSTATSEHGSIYTHYLLQAMHNQSLYDKELRTLTISDMHQYAVKKIFMETDFSQTPFYLSKQNGYYPFAYKIDSSKISNNAIEIEIEENGVQALLNYPGLNLPAQFKRDFALFLTELSLNLYQHNRATRVTVKIEGNKIEILDYSRKSFNPFTAQKTQTGGGVVTYNLFLNKYKTHVKTEYIEGHPNQIMLEFDEIIFYTEDSNPCHIDIEEEIIYATSALNKYELSEDCSEIVINISKTLTPLSFNLIFFDYLITHTLRDQLIILKMDKNDIHRDYAKQMLSWNEKYKRIMVI